MKRLWALLLLGIFVLSLGVGIWVDASIKHPVISTTSPKAQITGRPDIVYVGSGLEGFGAGLTVAGGAMVTVGTLMIRTRRKD